MAKAASRCVSDGEDVKLPIAAANDNRLDVGKKAQKLGGAAGKAKDLDTTKGRPASLPTTRDLGKKKEGGPSVVGKSRDLKAKEGSTAIGKKKEVAKDGGTNVGKIRPGAASQTKDVGTFANHETGRDSHSVANLTIEADHDAAPAQSKSATEPDFACSGELVFGFDTPIVVSNGSTASVRIKCRGVDIHGSPFIVPVGPCLSQVALAKLETLHPRVGVKLADESSRKLPAKEGQAEHISGLRVMHVVAGEAAATAGVQVGQYLVSVDGVTMDTNQRFERIIRCRTPGDPLRFPFLCHHRIATSRRHPSRLGMRIVHTRVLQRCDIPSLGGPSTADDHCWRSRSLSRRSGRSAIGCERLTRGCV